MTLYYYLLINGILSSSRLNPQSFTATRLRQIVSQSNYVKFSLPLTITRYTRPSLIKFPWQFLPLSLSLQNISSLIRSRHMPTTIYCREVAEILCQSASQWNTHIEIELLNNGSSMSPETLLLPGSTYSSKELPKIDPETEIHQSPSSVQSRALTPAPATRRSFSNIK